MTLDPIPLSLAFLAGAALGAGYMAALWFSVRELAQARHPLAGLLGGAALRIGVLLGLFYLVMDGDAARLLAGLVGFVVVRTAATRWVRRRAVFEPGA